MPLESKFHFPDGLPSNHIFIKSLLGKLRSDFLRVQFIVDDSNYINIYNNGENIPENTHLIFSCFKKEIRQINDLSLIDNVGYFLLSSLKYGRFDFRIDTQTNILIIDTNEIKPSYLSELFVSILSSLGGKALYVSKIKPSVKEPEEDLLSALELTGFRYYDFLTRVLRLDLLECKKLAKNKILLDSPIELKLKLKMSDYSEIEIWLETDIYKVLDKIISEN